MLDVPMWLWVAFGAIVVVALAVDLLAHRDDHVIGFKEAALWSAGWVGLAVIFGGVVFAVLGSGAGVEYSTAWLLEKSLSVDNLFVFALIFGYFKVPQEYQHRVLFMGVIGALVFRAIFLGLGVAVVNQFTAILFVFAAILLYSAFKLVKGDDDSYDPSKSLALKLMNKVIPTTEDYHGTKFFIKQGAKWVGTPLLAVVVTIEAADLLFAVDSVPAVLAVSDEAFIVYTSNAFAILGLRALYFLLRGLLDKFHFLDKGLAIILAFIGVKLMMQAGHKTISTSIPEIPSLVSLAVIVVVLAGSIALSILRPQAAEDDEEKAPALDDPAQAGRASEAPAGPGGGEMIKRPNPDLERDTR
ncbi:TerC family protein [Rhodococcus sp. X156]|uniref:TerC family protein n=1 Tax=Rhodococcus sp. X156 TaxID=2499145 RepID=UPI001F493D55|nr:TerC family protein [Rhodococcus sp. X156]